MRLTAAFPSRRSMVPTRRHLLAQGASIPAPTGGWDAFSNISAMPPTHALTLDNWFPQTSWVELRNGYVLQSNTGTGLPVETVMAYHGLTADSLFAASDDSVFDVTSRGATASTVRTGLGSARIQYTNFSTSGGNFLWCCNGVDDPFYYNGTAWATAAITGINGSDIVYVNPFKQRLFFIFNNSTAFGYLDVDSIQGAGQSFELGGFLSLGGYLVAMATWTIDAGTGPEDYAVFVSSRGQVIVYRGSDPNDAATWALIGVFNMGEPIGRRCLFRVGADVAIICIDGVVPLSKSLIYERAAVVKISLTENIQRVMNASAAAYKNNFGWQLISYPKGTRAILNVPVAENVEQVQYVMNTLTGAWCQFIGMDFSCWELFQENMYAGGNDGKVYLTDTSGSDNGTSITYTLETAFNYLNKRGQKKRVTMCQPLINTDGQITPSIGVNTDFQQNAVLSTQSSTIIQSAEWDAATWDTSLWPAGASLQSSWINVSGFGQAMSVKMEVSLTPQVSGSTMIWGQGTWGTNTWGSSLSDAPEVTLQINSFNITYEPGSAFV